MTVFVTVVETEGFASAARKLNVSPSVITRVINDLEKHIGVRLLTRTTRFVRLTEAGGRFFDDCRRILTDIEAAELAIVAKNSAPSGLLTVTAPMMFGSMYVLPIALEYLSRYPAVNLNCWFVDRVVNLVDEGVDIGVRIGELPSSSLQAIAVGSVRRVLCASPEYLEAHGEPTTPSDLAEHVTIQATGITPAPEWRFNVDGKAVSIPIQPRIISTNNESAIQAALEGVGIVRLLSYQIAREIADGKLRILLPDAELPTLPVSVVHREGRHQHQKVRAFLDLTIETLRSKAASWRAI